jgi:RNA polymerase sigma-70 factor (ECF subfamily)
VDQDKSRGIEDAGKRAGISEAERQEKLAALAQKRSKLSPEEAALLGELFPAIVAAYSNLVRDLLRKDGLQSSDADDLLQEVFLALYNKIVETGFVDSIPGMLTSLVTGRSLNHRRSQKRAPFSNDQPTSSTEKPRSQLDVERALHFKGVARQILSRLSPEHKEVIEKVHQKGLSYADAAAALGIPEGTLKSRLLAAKRAFVAAAEKIVPPSQRGPV